MIRRWVWLSIVLSGASTTLAQLPPVPQEAETTVVKGPQAHVAKRLVDLGTILEGDKTDVRWLLQNRGKSDLIIRGTRSSCGCAVVKLKDDQKVIPPGEILEFVVTFDSSGRRGIQNKSVTILTNDPAEPELKLTFKANMQYLYEIQPSAAIVNLRAVRRGETVRRTIDIYPGPSRRSVRVIGIELPEWSPLSFKPEPFEAGKGTGQRLRMTVSNDVSLGALRTKATLKLNIDGLERKRDVSIRGEVVGDLTWHPRVIDTTRQPTLPGKRLAPITIRSTDKVQFDILEAAAEPYFDVTFEQTKKGTQGTQYSVLLTLRKDVPKGPFGTMLEAKTNSLDQPLVRVPVFGIVPEPIEVEPPIILLRQDGTPAGTERRVKVQAPPQHSLVLSEIACENKAVKAAVDWEASSRYEHLRYLNVALDGRLVEGKHQTVLTLMTNVPGAERLEIPITIEVPADSTR